MTSATATAFDSYWAALAAGDSAAAIAVATSEQQRGVALADVLTQLVCASQNEVGRRWAANEWNVAQEHRATSVSEDVVAAISAATASTGTGRGVLVTCADGEWHSLPSRVLAAVLRDAGCRVTFLGASVPTRHLTQLLDDVGPDVVAISCALPTRLFDAREMIEAARSTGTPVIVGGRGFGPDGRWGRALGANGWAPDARSAVQLIESGELPPFTTPVPPLAAPDDAIDRLRDSARVVVDETVQRMLARLPDVARYNRPQMARTEEDTAHIVNFLCAALFVDDEVLFIDFVGWLGHVLVSRGVAEATLAAGLREVGTTIETVCGALPRAQRFLAAGIAAASAPSPF
jgi:methanogenic corrinoid protein MtbC1